MQNKSFDKRNGRKNANKTNEQMIMISLVDYILNIFNILKLKKNINIYFESNYVSKIVFNFLFIDILFLYIILKFLKFIYPFSEGIARKMIWNRKPKSKSNSQLLL